MPSAACCSTSTPVNTSRRRSPARDLWRRIPTLRLSTTRGSSCSCTLASTPWPPDLVCLYVAPSPSVAADGAAVSSAVAEPSRAKELQSLAHSKIHRINSTAQGEIAYARYVYLSTPSDDTTIRKPIAAFWAHRSHVLRHEAEEAFRKMCLDFPEFAFDVLSLVLDAKEKTKDKEPVGSSRKRARVSGAADRTPRT